MSGGWRARGRCAETDPEIFFPEKGHATLAARKICLSCEVQAECRAYALDNPDLVGVWGGTSVQEWRQLRHEQEAS